MANAMQRGRGPGAGTPAMTRASGAHAVLVGIIFFMLPPRLGMHT
jgi:hypothetical protein